jgi:hypothetical protein
MTAARPKVPFAYFTCSPQTLRVVEAVADVPHAHRCQAGSFKSRTTMIALQTVAAVVEAGAGLALLGLPSLTASLLLGSSLESSAAESLARVGGAAIVALAIVCWLARRDVNSPAAEGVVVALLFYNLVVAGVLAFASFGHDLHGILLWPAVAFHIAMAAWCVVTLLRNEERTTRSNR